jgi:hypothetical protein
MLPNKTFLGNFAALSVNVNGLIVPGRSVETVLARHALNLVLHNDHETFKVRLVGSATAVRFNGRYILLCTNHQIQGLDPEKVSMLKDDGSVLVTSSGMRSYPMSAETDAYDIAAFDFTEPVNDHPDLKKRFFDLEQVPPDALNVDVIAVLLAGYPAQDQNYDLAENNHLGLRRRHVVCLLHGQPSDEVMLTVRAETLLQDEPDGMSGGSAFVIQLLNGEPHAYFAGLIVRGGKEFFHILKSGVVVGFLRSAFP